MLGLGVGLTSLPVLGGAFAGDLDALDNLYLALGVKRLLSSYPVASPLLNLRRSSDNADMDFAPETAGGEILSATIQAWLDEDSAATAFVNQVYDQLGGTRHAAQATDANQPTVSLAGQTPVISFDGVGTQFLNVAALGFARNVNAASLICTRRHSALSGTRFLVHRSGNTAAKFRAGMFLGGPPAESLMATGTRTDAQSPANTPVIAGDTSWHTQVAQYGYEAATLTNNVGGTKQTNASWHDGGGPSADTDAAAFTIGVANGSFFFAGDITVLAGTHDLLTDQEEAALVAE